MAQNTQSAAIAVRHLVKAYVRGKPVLNGITLDIAAHGITAIIGPSGTGKSTLIRCINRLDCRRRRGDLYSQANHLIG